MSKHRHYLVSFVAIAMSIILVSGFAGQAMADYPDPRPDLLPYYGTIGTAWNGTNDVPFQSESLPYFDDIDLLVVSHLEIVSGFYPVYTCTVVGEVWFGTSYMHHEFTAMYGHSYDSEVFDGGLQPSCFTLEWTDYPDETEPRSAYHGVTVTAD